MKAIVQERYGPPEEVLELREIETPTAGDGEVLVDVRASAVAGDDWHLMRGLPYVARTVTGLRRPKTRIPGRDVAGVIEAVGEGAVEFAVGDEVYGWCEGAFAESAAIPEANLAEKPANLTLEEAAVVPVSGFTALQAILDEGRVRAGRRVLVVGASGGVGTFAVQIAKAYEAEVTGVCGTDNVDLVWSLGADRVLDYTKTDFASEAGRYDVIVDLVGNRSVTNIRRALAEDGTLVLIGSAGLARSSASDLRGLDRWFMGVHGWIGAVIRSRFTHQRLRPLVHLDRKADLLTLTELIESGKVTPVVSATYPLAETPAAIAHFEAGHARGKVAISI